MVVMCICDSNVHAQALFSEPYAQIYHKILRFEIEDASQELDGLNRKTGKQAAPHHLLENYIDCLYLFVTEDKDAYDKLKDAKKQRIKTLSAVRSDVMIEYTIADIELQWAAVRFKFGDYFSAFTEVRRAYKSLSKIVDEYPDYYPAQMRLAILKILIGTIPDAYQWGVKLIGMSGDVKGGFDKLDMAIARARNLNDTFLAEVLAAKSMLVLQVLNDEREAKKIIEHNFWNDLRGPLVTFLTISLYRKTGDNEKAIAYLEQMNLKHEGQQLPYLYFLAGDAYLKAMDASAKNHLESYIKYHKGDQFIKSAYQRLAWYEAIYVSPYAYLKMIQKVTENGSNLMDEDKSAQKEADRAVPPHRGLLRSRLLFDGGNYDEAKQQLDVILYELQELSPIEIIEYYYRLARVYDKKGETVLALYNYNKVIEIGQANPAYFASNAALLSALIYEKKGDTVMADKMFNLCLKIKPEEYRTGIHQKAKSGLARLKG